MMKRVNAGQAARLWPSHHAGLGGALLDQAIAGIPCSWKIASVPLPRKAYPTRMR